MDFAQSCQLCGSRRHLWHQTCPIWRSIAIPLDPLPAYINDELNGVIRFVFALNAMTEERQRAILAVRDRVIIMLRAHFDASMHALDLYGSMANGFACRFSDLDLCLELRREQMPDCAFGGDSAASTSILLDVAYILDESDEFEQVEAVTNARVPIVKFVSAKDDLKIDLGLCSQFSRLGARSTLMFKLYASLDARVRILVVMVKSWARHCGIGDASAGALSSYAWTVMLIHFLQRCKPPVLPVLQERRWSSANRRSPAELWIAFLDYYAAHFAFDRTVVQIRRLAERPRYPNERWSRRPIVLQDPFELERNLAGGLQDETSQYIYHCFRRSRYVFGQRLFRDKFVHEESRAENYDISSPEQIEQFARYLFDRCRLLRSAPTGIRQSAFDRQSRDL